MPDSAELRIFKHKTFEGGPITQYIPKHEFKDRLKGRGITYVRHAIISAYICMSGIDTPQGMTGLIPPDEIIDYFDKHNISGLTYVKDTRNYGVLELFAIFDSDEDMAVYVLGNDKYLESIHE